MGSFTWATILPIVVKIVGGLVTLISPELRTEITNVITGLQNKAKSTSNPWDNVLATLLADVFGVQG